MNEQSKGFILFMTLSTLVVISMLLVTCLHHVLLLHKVINQQEGRHQRFYQLEYVAKQLINTPSKIDKRCIQATDLINKVIPQLLNNSGCLLEIGKYRYRYLIEDLGYFPCLILVYESQVRATHHFRLSLVSLAEAEIPATGLQTRYIQAAKPLVCSGEAHQVSSGISSWRYFPLLS